MSNGQYDSDNLLNECNGEKHRLSEKLNHSIFILTKQIEKISEEKDSLYHLKEKLGYKQSEFSRINSGPFQPLKYFKIRREKEILSDEIRRFIGLINNAENLIKDKEREKDDSTKNIEDIKRKIEEKQNEIYFITFQREKGLELFEGRWVEKSDIPRLKEIRIGLSNNFSNLTAYEFEHFVARLLQEMGYEADVTKRTGDYGVDIIAKKDKQIIAIQCKRYTETNLVGNRDIQRCLGSMHTINAKRSIFVTTSFYTKQALKQAEGCPIELWDKETFHELVKKYLLDFDIKEILSALEMEQLREKERRAQEELEKFEKKQKIIEKKGKKEQEKIKKKEELIKKREEQKRKLEEKKKREQEKTICPLCGGGKMKTRKYCSRCKAEMRYNYYDDDYW